MLASTTVAGKIGVFIREAADGTKLNSNRIVINLTGPVTLVDATKIRAFGFAINPLSRNLAQTRVNIRISDVQVINNGTAIQFNTDRQVRKNGRILIDSGGFRGADNNFVVHNDSEGTRKTFPKGLNKERYTLASRAWVPSDFAYFSNARFSQSPAPTQANQPQNANTVRAQLVDFLGKKVAAGTITSARRDAALADYDSSANASIAPSPVIRAAIVSLVGTVAEPAIESFFRGQNATGRAPTVMNFDGSLFSSSARFVETKVLSNGRLRVIFNPDYQGESFVALSALLGGEAHINDNLNSQDEEIIANGLTETTVWAQQITTDDNYAAAGTVLVTRNNYHLLALLNSGDAQFPRVGIKQAPLVGPNTSVVPGATLEFGSQPVVSVEDLIRREMAARNIGDNANRPGNVVTDAILSRITGKTYSGQVFSKALLADVDLSQGALGDRLAVLAARALRLDLTR
jgi:hypothetical protein